VEGLVNSADVFLANSMAGGLNKAIHQAAGDQLKGECKLYGKSATGNVTITRGTSFGQVKEILLTIPRIQSPRQIYHPCLCSQGSEGQIFEFVLLQSVG